MSVNGRNYESNWDNNVSLIKGEKYSLFLNRLKIYGEVEYKKQLSYFSHCVHISWKQNKDGLSVYMFSRRGTFLYSSHCTGCEI